MKTKIYIDGSEGTTGLRIFERMARRDDVELIKIDPELRKDPTARAKCINASNITFLCLPDSAAVEAVSLVSNDNVRIIDASTAHRTAPDWAYGFAELSPAHRAAIENGKRIANPGCHATGFISLVYPLVKGGLLAEDAQVSCFSLTGYSGGGKKMIAQYQQAERRDAALDAPRPYGLTQQHKHLKEMQAICGLKHAPLFTPIVADYYAGMLVSVPLTSEMLGGATLSSVHECFADAYAGQKLVKVMPLSAQTDVGGFLSANALAGHDSLEIIVTGNDERITVCSLFDNLGKGASGAAVQSMNIMMGCDETTGLVP